jgi:hypothetical protein
MTNCIVLESIESHVSLFLVLMIAIIGFIGFAVALKGESKIEKIKSELYEEREKNINLNRDNMRLKLKCGELKAGERVDV